MLVYVQSMKLDHVPNKVVSMMVVVCVHVVKLPAVNISLPVSLLLPLLLQLCCWCHYKTLLNVVFSLVVVVIVLVLMLTVMLPLPLSYCLCDSSWCCTE